MNREILFKAKRIEWRNLPKEQWWVEGDVQRTADKSIILIISDEYKAYLCDSSTLSQYTGLTDKNGQKIWGNDILYAGESTKLRVSWHHFKASWVLSKKGWMYNHFFGEAVEPEDVEVIGNIFDNAE